MTYSKCLVVNTWGLIDACHYKPNNVYASYHKMVSYPPFSQLVETVKSGRIKQPLIFCHPAAVRDFIQRFLKNIDFNFVLVSSHWDSDMPIGELTENEIIYLLKNPYLVRWYMQNCVIKHPKVTGIAIGLDYHTLANSNGDHQWGKMETPIQQDTSLLKLRSMMTPVETRIKKCYSTCHMFIGRGHGRDRIDALNKIPSSLLFLEKERVSRDKSWENQMKYAFVLSPHGNGLDCHRTWEAITLGCIPIVKTSPIDRVFNNLPVLIVKNWADVTPDLLDNTISRFKHLCNTDEIPERLKLKYWTEHMRKGDDIN